MLTYRYTSEEEHVFGHLHADTSSVDGSAQEGTLVLRPGDVLHTPDAQVHAYLDPADDETRAATDEAAAVSEPAESPAPATRTRRRSQE